MQQLAQADVEAAFREMGEILYRARKTGEIAVFGGAAILLQFETSFRTGDVDAIVQNGDHGAIMQAAADVASRRGWLRSWFSEAVQNYVTKDAGSAFHATYPSPDRPGLRVYVARPDYLLAMKLRAMRVGSRDEADAARLARACGITTFAAMQALVASYFPREPISDRSLAIIAQFAGSLAHDPPA
jgi:hypothetical protein